MKNKKIFAIFAMILILVSIYLPIGFSEEKPGVGAEAGKAFAETIWNKITGAGTSMRRKLVGLNEEETRQEAVKGAIAGMVELYNVAKKEIEISNKLRKEGIPWYEEGSSLEKGKSQINEEKDYDLIIGYLADADLNLRRIKTFFNDNFDEEMIKEYDLVKFRKQVYDLDNDVQKQINTLEKLMKEDKADGRIDGVVRRGWFSWTKDPYLVSGLDDVQDTVTPKNPDLSKSKLNPLNWWRKGKSEKGVSEVERGLTEPKTESSEGGGGKGFFGLLWWWLTIIPKGLGKITGIDWRIFAIAILVILVVSVVTFRWGLAGRILQGPIFPILWIWRAFRRITGRGAQGGGGGGRQPQPPQQHGGGAGDIELD